MSNPQSTIPNPQSPIPNPQSPIPNRPSSIAHEASPVNRPAVRIGSKRIGATNPVYVIAEAGVNHNGDIAVAHRLIDAAHRAAADAVKFQVFSADRLVAASTPSCGYQQKNGGAAAQRDVLRRLELGLDALRDLKTHADRLGIEFVATPFGLPELRFLADLGVRAVKIASSDLVNVPLLAAAAGTGLPMIVSTGASLLTEIDAAVALIRGRATPGMARSGASGQSPISNPQSPIVHRPSSIRSPLILLHCVSAYPTRPRDARLACMGTLARRFNVPVGFSDHTPDPAFSGLAVAAGATLLEKHLTLDRGAPGPDHSFSLEPEPFARYVAAARDACAALGDGEVRVAPEERDVRKLARGSIVTAAAVAAGQALTTDHLTVRRQGDGIGAARWNDVVGRIAKTDIPAETRLAWSMLE